MTLFGVFSTKPTTFHGVLSFSPQSFRLSEKSPAGFTPYDFRPQPRVPAGFTLYSLRRAFVFGKRFLPVPAGFTPQMRKGLPKQVLYQGSGGRRGGWWGKAGQVGLAWYEGQVGPVEKVRKSYI